MSAPRNPNRRMAQAIVEELDRCGVTDACLSPGSRSTALALALDSAPSMRVFVAGDERSGGFFALGLARERRRPVVLLCTSGTAAANYLPAIVEASLSDVPLIVVTADRPPELRDCGAPQTITQVGLFAAHVRWSVDVPAPSAELDLERYYRVLACRAVAAAVEPPPGPVHLNVPMREPLFDPAEENAAASRARRRGALRHGPCLATGHRARDARRAAREARPRRPGVDRLRTGNRARGSRRDHGARARARLADPRRSALRVALRRPRPLARRRRLRRVAARPGILRPPPS